MLFRLTSENTGGAKIYELRCTDFVFCDLGFNDLNKLKNQ